jgi:hypothetical protein
VLARLDEIEANAATEPFAELPFPAFCERWLKVQNKDGDIVPLVLNRTQIDIAKHLTLFDRLLILKARQVGVSTVIQAWHYYQMARGNTRVSTLCHDDDLTVELREMADRFHDNIPEAYRPKRKYANAKVTTYPDNKSRARIATVGGHATQNSTGKKKGRGGSNTDVHGTEVGFWPDAEGVMSAAMQAGRPNIVLESTPNGMVGAFYEWAMQALDKLGIWKLLFYEWWWDDEYRKPLTNGETITYTPDEQALVDKHGLDAEQIKWRRAKQAELPHTFAQEYPEDPRTCFLASGKSYFRNVEHVFTAPLFAASRGRRFVGGLDFAQTDDFTVLIIIDADTYEMVDFLRINNLEWQEMRRQVAVMAHKWNARIIGEANSMGKTNIELLQKGEYDDSGNKLYDGIDLTPFDTTPVSKPPLIQGLYHALHEMGMRLQDYSDIRHELRAFISKQTITGHWQYSASGGAHDDCVMALALSWHGVNAPQATTTTITIPALFGRD